MEKIMSKTNETFGGHDTLADSELGAVTGAMLSLGYRATTNPSLSVIGGIKGESTDDR